MNRRTVTTVTLGLALSLLPLAFSTGAPFAVEFGGDRVNGSGEVQGFEGDRAANAVTKYHAKGQVTIKS